MTHGGVYSQRQPLPCSRRSQHARGTVMANAPATGSRVPPLPQTIANGPSPISTCISSAKLLHTQDPRGKRWLSGTPALSPDNFTPTSARGSTWVESASLPRSPARAQPPRRLSRASMNWSKPSWTILDRTQRSSQAYAWGEAAARNFSNRRANQTLEITTLAISK